MRSLPPKSKSCVKSLFERLIYPKSKDASEKISLMYHERRAEQQKVFRMLLISTGCPKKLFPVCVAVVVEPLIQLSRLLHNCIGQAST